MQPSAGDGGGALGAALWAYHSLLGKPREFVMGHAYWGRSYTEAGISEFLHGNDIASHRFDDDSVLFDHVVDRLMHGKGWVVSRPLRMRVRARSATAVSW